MYRYTYRPSTGQLKIKIAMQIHAMVSMWAAKLIAEGGAVGAWNPDDIQFIPEGRLQRFAAQYEGM